MTVWRSPHSSPNRSIPSGDNTGRKTIEWRVQVKAQLRRIDQPTAIRLLQALAHYAATCEGDVKRPQNIDPPEYRLRVGDYRVRFQYHGDTLYITAIKHRREAYR